MSGKEAVMAVFARARAFWEARVLLTAAELDIFSALVGEPKTAGQVAEELSSDSRATEMILDALVAMDLLIKEDNKFSVKPGLEKALSKSAPETVLPLIQHMAHLWDTWGNLTEIVKTGGDKKSLAPLDRDEEGIKAFIGAMHTIGRGMAQGVVGKLDLSRRQNLIDIGGGSGVYTIAMLKAVPNMRATVFDRPPVIELAKEKIAEENLTERVTFVKGDFYKDNLPGGHDTALLSAIIHQNSSKENVGLYKKTFEALDSGGLIVIRDHVMSDDHTESKDGALFAINMLVNTPGGGTYSFAEIKQDLEEAGFTNARLAHLAEMDSIVTAEKP